MTSRTPRRHRRLALMAAGTVAAMVLVPGTALAQETTPLDDPSAPGLEQLAELLAPAEAAVPAVPAVPGSPALPLDDSDDDSDGHETEDPEFPDNGSGFVLDLNLEEGEDILDEDDILELTRYDATIEDDGSTHSDVSVLSLLGDELTESSSSSDGSTESSENVTGDICESLEGLVCLSLLYEDTIAFQNETESVAAARGGVLALCLLNEGEEDVTASYECDGLLGLGVAEGLGTANRDAKTGHTEAMSFNELLSVCLAGERNDLNGDDGGDGDGGDEGIGGGDGGGDPGVRGNENRFACDGLLGAQAAHSDTDAESVTPDTQRRSWLLGLDSGGEELFRLDDPTSLELLSDCGDELSILCLFLNQGESFIFENPRGAGSAQEALHLDLLQDTPLDILLELGRSEAIAHQEAPPKKPECDDKKDNDGDGKIDFPADPGCDNPDDDSEKDKPECKDGIDNDGDGKIDFPADPECDSADDDSESDGKKGDGGLADTGADVAPLLAGAFLLIGMGALTVAATRRRIGKHSI